MNSPADDDGDDDHDDEEDNKAPTDHDDGEIGLGHKGGHRSVYLDITLVAQPSNIPGLAGELSLHSLCDLELSGGGENCRCKSNKVVIQLLSQIKVKIELRS